MYGCENRFRGARVRIIGRFRDCADRKGVGPRESCAVSRESEVVSPGSDLGGPEGGGTGWSAVGVTAGPRPFSLADIENPPDPAANVVGDKDGTVGPLGDADRPVRGILRRHQPCRTLEAVGKCLPVAGELVTRA